MSENSSLLWKEIKNNLKKELPQSSYETWLGNVRVSNSNNGNLHLSVPSGFIKRGIEEKFLSSIRNQVEQLTGERKEIVINVDELHNGSHNNSNFLQDISEVTENDESPQTNYQQQSEKSSKIPLNKDYTFDTFVQSKSNQLASAASKAAAETPAKAYNPLFIYAKVGLGKTHLLHAIGNYLKQTLASSYSNVIYTTSERFAIEMIQAIRKNNTDQFRKRYRNVDGFLLDDVQFLENKEGTQEELFHTFNELYGNNKQIVLTSDRPPDRLSDLQDRLVSRFRWGLVADIQPPNFETRVAILRKKANQKGIKVEDKVLELIGSRITSNVRALEGALIQAVARADLTGGKLSREGVEECIPAEKKQTYKLTPETVKREVANKYGLTIEDLEGSSRKKKVARARHIAIYLSRELTENSFPALGKKFGDRDHSTIMHSHQKIKKMTEETPLFYEEVKELEQTIKTKL